MEGCWNVGLGLPLKKSLAAREGAGDLVLASWVLTPRSLHLRGVIRKSILHHLGQSPRWLQKGETAVGGNDTKAVSQAESPTGGAKGSLVEFPRPGRALCRPGVPGRQSQFLLLATKNPCGRNDGCFSPKNCTELLSKESLFQFEQPSL